MKKRTLLGLMAATPLAMLTGCGGSSGGSAQVRLLNASIGYDSLDLYVDGTKKAASVARGAVSSYASVDSGTHDDPGMVLTSAGLTTKLVTNASISLGKDKQYTLVAYGWAGAVACAAYLEDEDTPDAGDSSLSVFNTAYDAGALDVYLTLESDTTDLSSLTPLETKMTVKHASYQTLDPGTYRLRVTKYGDTSDMRLDVSGLVLSDKGIATLVLMPAGSGGVLVSAMLVQQGGAVTKFTNTKARVRGLPAVSDGSSVSLSLGSQALMSSLKSSTVQAYSLVEAGTYTVATTVANTSTSNTLATQSVTLDAGTDTTFLVNGLNPADAALTVLEDENRVSSATSRYQVRLLHAAASIASEAVTFAVSGSTVVTLQPYRTASDYEVKSSGTSLNVTVESQSGTIYETDDKDIASYSVYTMIVWDRYSSLTDTSTLTATLYQDYQAVFS